jgi:hypothetical protein
MPNEQAQSKLDTAEQPRNEGLSSSVLLGLGLYVIEARYRNRDKDLGPWKPECAFVHEAEVEWYFEQFKSTGYMRILRPNSVISVLQYRWKRYFHTVSVVMMRLEA